MKLMPKVKAHSKNGLLQNKDGSLTPGCLTRNLQHDWSKLDLSPLEAPGWRSQFKKAGRTSELCTQNPTPGPLLSSSSHKAIIRNAQTLVCRLEETYSQQSGSLPSARSWLLHPEDFQQWQQAGPTAENNHPHENTLQFSKDSVLFRKCSENTSI